MINVRIERSKKCNGEYSCFLTFPYDIDIINVIRELPDRYWHVKEKVWEIPYKKLSYIQKKLSGYKFSIVDNIEVEEVPKIDFNFKTKPFNHQIEGFNYGMQKNKWLLGDEQGLGKTKQVIDIAVAKKLQYGYKHCLIICGVNGLKWNWVNEISLHSNEGAYVLGQRQKNGKLIVDGNKAKLADLKAFDTIDEYFIITNVETLRNDEITAILGELCKCGSIGMIAADEVHKMKNPSSQQGKAFLKLKTKTMIALTGTPLMNTPLDLYIILRWLGYEKHSFYQFKNHYCVMGGYGGYQIVGYKNLDSLQSDLNEIMLRRLKSDVLDLPEKLHIDEYVEMTPKQKQIYDEVTNNIKMHIDEIMMVNNPLSELIRMRQATGYTGILSSTVRESAKLDRMEELVNDAIQNGKKVVVFSNWTQITNEVYKRLSKYGAVVVTGDIHPEIRNDAVYSFQNDDFVKVIIGTIGAMGTGLTLTAGTVEIFLDEPWNRANKEQAEDRCHWVGTTENITIYTLLCKNTIDERIHEILMRKGAMSDAIIDGKIVTDKLELLNYLLS